MPSVGDLARFAASFARHMQAENKSPKTIETYGEGIGQLLEANEYIGTNPVAKMHPRHVPEQPVPVIDLADIQALLHRSAVTFGSVMSRAPLGT